MFTATAVIGDVFISASLTQADRIKLSNARHSDSSLPSTAKSNKTQIELINFVGHRGILRFSTLKGIVDPKREEDEKKGGRRGEDAETGMRTQRERAKRTEEEV